MINDDNSSIDSGPVKKTVTKTGLKQFSKLKISSLPISKQIEYIQLKEKKLAEKGRLLIYKKINEYANEEYNRLLEENFEEDKKNTKKKYKPIKILCNEITDEHYSNGDCKRTIQFINYADRKKDKEDIKPIGKYTYWYNDSTIYMTSSHSSEGILVHDCFMDGLNEDKTEEFLNEIDDKIYWKWFK